MESLKMSKIKNTDTAANADAAAETVKAAAEEITVEIETQPKIMAGSLLTAEPKKKARKKPAMPLHLAKRYNPEISTGLTQAQVDERLENGLVNFTKKRQGKSYLQIFISNIFTFFNLIFLIVLAAYIFFDVLTLSRLLFIAPVMANAFIAVLQEVLSKRKLDKLSLVSAPMADVIRDGSNLKIPVNNIVLDDLVSYSVGKQISTDGIVEEGYIEVDESLLTGESEPVSKRKGEIVFAGSYVVSGHCIVRADKIGSYNYVQGLTAQARQYRKPRSQLLKTMKAILVVIAVIIVPLSVFSYLNNYNIGLGLSEEQLLAEGVSTAVQYAVIYAGTSTVSMIPVGAFLLTTIALAVSVGRLATQRTLVQELFCIEMLARVDVLCFDKTGTITDGTMSVENLIEVGKNDSRHSIEQILGSYLNSIEDNNMTSVALINKFGVNKLLKKTTAIPFSSSRKYSAVTFADAGSYFLGAPEFVVPGGTPKTDPIVKKYLERGCRVLMLAYSPSSIVKQDSGEFKIPSTRKPLALIVIEDRIRPDAIETIRWFKQNDVKIKVISGDNPIAVSEIARKVGIESASNYISLEGMNEEQVADAAGKYTVFGRVSPEQKAILVKAMKNAGSTVAMTGDGVNDILAMKEADCSISMAAGTDAAKNVAHLVLTDNNFGSMPKVVGEGRRVVNNIQSVAAMFYMKIIFMIVLTTFTLIASVPFPFAGENVLLIELAVVACPTALLALQRNHNIIKGNFFVNVMKRAVPFAMVFIVQTGIIYILYLGGFVEMPSLSTVISYCYIIAGFAALFFCSRPVNAFRGFILGGSAAIILFGILFMGGTLGYTALTVTETLLVFGLIQLSVTMMIFFTKASDSIRLKD